MSEESVPVADSEGYGYVLKSSSLWIVFSFVVFFYRPNVCHVTRNYSTKGYAYMKTNNYRCWSSSNCL